ncbi:MAG TPA: serine protease [Bacteroidales bacterium]|nr:serine protease [Bacteroidales bacterium]
MKKRNFYKSLKKTFFLLTGCCLVILLSVSCQNKSLRYPLQSTNKKEYVNDFSIGINNDELEQIAANVKKVFSIVDYDIYHFSESAGITQSKLAQTNLRRSSESKSIFNESVYGTATILQNNQNGILLLTCSHILNNPDTIISFFAEANKQTLIQSVAIKKSQMIFIHGNINNNLLKIIAIDPERDLVLLGSNELFDQNEQPEFKLKAGNSNTLQWGTQVYLMGFPGGHQMLTKANIGNPHSSSNGDFIVDVSFNPGGSGSIIMAINKNTHYLELVGIVKSASATYTNVLIPEKEGNQEIYNPNMPYEGDLFVKRARNINYGITFAVSVNTIRDFYIQSRKQITRAGFNLDNYFELK